MRACFPHNQFQSSTTVSVYASDSLGNTIPPGDIEDLGNAITDFPNASEEHNLRNVSRHSRVLFECIHGMQGIWRVASSIDLKQLNHHIDAPHFRMHTISSVLSIVEQEIVFKKDKATLHVISKKCEESNYSNKIRRQSDDTYIARYADE